MFRKRGRTKVTRKDLTRVFTEVVKELQQRPPVIGLVGVSGVGKSSTINKMFKTNLATSDTVACTKEFWAVDVEATYTKGTAQTPVTLRVVDAPGPGEDISRDPEYLEMYRTHLPQCDVILWILTARNRAIALDQRYLKELSEFHDKMVFGLNQVDLTEPLNWDQTINLPSPEQKENIDIIINDRRKRLEDILQRSIKLVPYSARIYFDPTLNYNLEELFVELLHSSPEDRAWAFGALKSFGLGDWIPKDLPEEIREIVGDQIGDATASDASSDPSQRDFTDGKEDDLPRDQGR